MVLQSHGIFLLRRCWCWARGRSLESRQGLRALAIPASQVLSVLVPMSTPCSTGGAWQPQGLTDQKSCCEVLGGHSCAAWPGRETQRLGYSWGKGQRKKNPSETDLPGNSNCPLHSLNKYLFKLLIMPKSSYMYPQRVS